MIVMAADYVGMHVVKFLCERSEKIEILVLDTGDRGHYNALMQKMVLDANPGVQILTQDQICDPETQENMKAKNIELGILAWWPHIIDNSQISITKRGFVNTHPGFLPFNRGKHPYFWSIADRTPFGVTLHYVDGNIDSGAIIAQKEIPVTWEDTGESLYQKSRELILNLFYDNFDAILGNTAPCQEQALEAGTFHYGKELEPICALSLDERYTARKLLNILRGRMFRGQGACSFIDGNHKYFVSINISDESPVKE